MASASSARAWRPVKIRSFAAARADQAGQPLGAAAARDDAEQDLGLPKARLLAGDAEVAGQRELAAAAEREAGDRRDGGARDVGDRVEGRRNS